jgi:hypothetical protein
MTEESGRASGLSGWQLVPQDRGRRNVRVRPSGSRAGERTGRDRLDEQTVKPGSTPPYPTTGAPFRQSHMTRPE